MTRHTSPKRRSAGSARAGGADAQARRRPLPPDDLTEIAWGPGHFRPDPALTAWVRDTFVHGITGSALQNEEHGHLALAHLGFLWTNARNARHGRVVLGTAERFDPKGDGWVRARQEAQLVDWFGSVPDFLITLSAPYAAACDDASFCALVEHELSHCGQLDRGEGPVFNSQTGLPVWTIRGHDLEEFTSVVRRYGMDAVPGARAFVEAALAGPTIMPAQLKIACGVCLRRAA